MKKVLVLLLAIFTMQIASAQEEVKKSIDGLKGKSTIVIVAHRLSTIKNVDTIYFLENGEIKGMGSFNELFENNKDFQNMFLIENI